MEVHIRPLRATDALVSFKWRNNPILWEFTGKQPDKVITPEIETKWIIKAISDSNCKRFAIIANNMYVGNIQLTNIEKNKAEYHIFIGETDYWGKGIAYKASNELFKYIKKNFSFKFVYLFVNAKHESAIYLYKKLGFKIVSYKNEFIKMEKPLIL